MPKEKDVEVEVFGKLIGNASGWDEVDVTIFQFYDVELTQDGKDLFGVTDEGLEEIPLMTVDPWNGSIELFSDESDEPYKTFSVSSVSMTCKITEFPIQSL